MTDSDPQLIRHATIDDLDALAAMESECFPAAEAADRSSLRARIETYPECWPFAVWCGWVCQVVTVLRSSLPQVR